MFPSTALDRLAEWKISIETDLGSIKEDMKEVKRALGIRTEADPDSSPRLAQEPEDGF